ncbi:hypothetical protein TSMEX_005029 [Taenia solium]|eukprot:TsM_001002900 transcript=TsM_001002900 gene=TsM_001002900
MYNCYGVTNISGHEHTAIKGEYNTLEAKLMYFSDGIRQVDYIVAFHFSSPSDEEPLKDFLTNLLQHGVNIEAFITKLPVAKSNHSNGFSFKG